MRDALQQAGVPPDAITLDYAGFRTLDSVVRARDVFGLSRVVIVSQDFHSRRALFIADRIGLDAIAYEAKAVTRRHRFQMRAREALARTRAVIDMCVLGTQPKFPGPPEPIVLQQ